MSAWHVEVMSLFSINYIHFGAPKFRYAIPQGNAVQTENTLRCMSLFYSITPRLIPSLPFLICFASSYVSAQVSPRSHSSPCTKTAILSKLSGAGVKRRNSNGSVLLREKWKVSLQARSPPEMHHHHSRPHFPQVCSH